MLKNHKIKVAHVITRLDPGGSAENTLLTIKGLDPARYSLTLIYGKTVHHPKADLQEIEAKGIEVIYIESLIRPIRIDKDLVVLFKLYHLFKDRKFDMVHTHSSKAGLLGRLAAYGAGVKYIVHTPHGHVFYGYFNPLTNAILILLERWLGKITNRLITLTERGKEEHVAYRILPAERIVSIYSGIQIEKFQENDVQIASEFERLGPGPFVGIVARLVPIKGHRYLIKAIPKILQEIPTVRFLFVGGGPLRGTLEAQCHLLDISHAVFFLEERPDIRPFLKGFTVVVLTSLNEGMGRVLLEAQAMGKPVIGTRVGGIPEVIQEGETGFVVPPKDSKALAEVILTLLKDHGKRQVMGQAARRWVKGKFGINEMVSKISRLYEELLQEL